MLLISVKVLGYALLSNELHWLTEAFSGVFWVNNSMNRAMSIFIFSPIWVISWAHFINISCCEDWMRRERVEMALFPMSSFSCFVDRSIQTDSQSSRTGSSFKYCLTCSMLFRVMQSWKLQAVSQFTHSYRYFHIIICTIQSLYFCVSFYDSNFSNQINNVLPVIII